MNRSGSAKKVLGFLVVWLVILGGLAATYKYLVEPNGGLPIPFLGKSDNVEVPFILWGGDAATFLANGGLETKPGSLFARQGLKVKLTRGDDIQKQVKDYLGGKSPFFRGTMSMLGQASEELAKDPAAQPVVFLQLTWSAGDYLVGRPNLRNLNDLRGKRIALQKGGPHVGMLNDILETAKLHWQDIRIAWTDDITGDKGPETQFRKDPSIDACFVVTTDMLKLTGGADKTGTGVAGTAEGAHVVVSTKDMLRSIADVYACRKDYYDAHKEWVEKFAAAYLKACEELRDLKKGYEQKQAGAADRYRELLKLTQDIYGKEDIPDEGAAADLIADALFAYLPGNYRFFKDTTNLSGFRLKMKAALDLAIALHDARERHEFLTADFDYEQLKSLGGLSMTLQEQSRKFKPNVPLPNVTKLAKDTLYSFEVNYPPGVPDFSAKEYEEKFQRAVEQSSLFGRAIIAIRGHADVGQLLKTFVGEGIKTNLIRRTGQSKKYRYFLKADDSEFELSDTAKVVALIEAHMLPESKAVLDSCIDLSRQRAEAARRAVLEYARSKNYQLDENQIVAVGAGVLEPLSPVPRTDEDLARNRRVEFRILRASTEALSAGGLDL